MLRALLILLIVLVCPDAKAENPDAKAQARAHFNAGAAHFAAGRYVEAVVEYDAAYKLAPVAGILFNLGQAHRMKGDKKAALDAYQRYLVVEPSGPVAPEARTQVDILLREQAAEQAALDRRERERRDAELRAMIAAQKTQAAQPEPSVMKRKPWLWAVIAVGAAAVVGGVTAGVVLGTQSHPTSLGEMNLN